MIIVGRGRGKLARNPAEKVMILMLKPRYFKTYPCWGKYFLEVSWLGMGLHIREEVGGVECARHCSIVTQGGRIMENLSSQARCGVQQLLGTFLYEYRESEIS